jgi:hypothetical protein
MRYATLQGIITVALATIAKDTQQVPKDLYETVIFLNGKKMTTFSSDRTSH